MNITGNMPELAKRLFFKHRRQWKRSSEAKTNNPAEQKHIQKFSVEL